MMKQFYEDQENEKQRSKEEIKECLQFSFQAKSYENQILWLRHAVKGLFKLAFEEDFEFVEAKETTMEKEQ